MTTNNLATPQTWQIAQDHLSTADLKRLACCYFFSDHTKVDYESAAAAYGSASANSFRVMLGTAVKKVRDIEANGGTLPSPTKPRGGGKRKKEEDGDDADTPKKKAGRPKKVKASEAGEANAKVDEGIAGIDGLAGIDGVKEEEEE